MTRVLVLALVLVARAVMAQPAANPSRTIPPPCVPALEQVRSAPAETRSIALQAALRLNQNASCFAALLMQDPAVEQSAYRRFVKALEGVRTDKQAGSSSGTGGSTSLVSKGLAAQALSVAAEYGAVTESVNKQVVTIQTGLNGVIAGLIRQRLFPYCPSNGIQQPGCVSGVPAAARRISAGVSFDTSAGAQTISASPSGPSQGTAQPVTFTADRHQITQANVRLVLMNERDATSQAFQNRWAAALAPATTGAGQGAAGLSLLEATGQSLLTALQTLLSNVTSRPEYRAWYDSALRDLNEAAPGDIETKWQTHAAELVAIIKNAEPNFAMHVLDFAQALSRYQFEEQQFIEDLANKPVITLEYTNNRPPLQPTRSLFRVVVDKGLDGQTSVVANAAFEFYDSGSVSPVVTSRLRDLQFGVQIERNLGALPVVGAAAVSGTYYFQHQSNPAVLNVTPSTPLTGITLTDLPAGSTQVFAEKGNLHVGQVKLVLGAGQSGTRVPIAFSYSNRTELIAKSTWSAQIGISYDFDSLFAR